MQRQKKPRNAVARGNRSGRRRGKPRDGAQSSSKSPSPKSEERSIATTGHDPALVCEAQDKPRNHRELGQAILAVHNPVAVGCELLQSKSESVKARAFETTTNWAYGKSGPATGGRGSGRGVRIIWDMPAPPYERTDPEEGMDDSSPSQTRSVSQEQE
jgi:hypothetical protein